VSTIEEAREQARAAAEIVEHRLAGRGLGGSLIREADKDVPALRTSLHALRTLLDATEPRPITDERTPEFEAIEQELFKHQPVLSMSDGHIAGCQCLDRVFQTRTEDWGTHLAEVFEHHNASRPITDEMVEAAVDAAWNKRTVGIGGQVVYGPPAGLYRMVRAALEAAEEARR